jgi:hypothetical protein
LRIRLSRRGTLGGLACAVLAAALALFFTVAAPADSPNLTLTATDAVVGGQIHATADLAETPNASGGISFEVFGPGDEDCSGPALNPAPAPASVTGEGEYASGEITPPSAGTYYWSAHYSGDLENPPAESTCSAISSVGKASPGLTGSASSGAVGTAIHDKATVTGGFSPTGEVTFSVYGPTDTDCSTPLKTAAVPLQGGLATSADFLAQQAGEFHWTAEYEGDANNEVVALGCGAPNQDSTVGKASPSLSGTATSAAKVGLTITDSATLSEGFAAGGQLVFHAYGPGDPTCATPAKYEATVPVSGNDTYSPPGFAPGAGLYRWTVEYEGDANNEAALLGCGTPNQASTVNKAPPTLAGTATPAVKVGSSITNSVTLAGGSGPGGQLIFRAYGPGDQSCASAAKYEAAVPVSGNGTYSPAGFAPGTAGTYRWTVEYAGDANNEAATLACGAANQDSTVNKATPTLAGMATSPVKAGFTITDSVTLAGGFAAGGQLVFHAYGPGDQSCASAAAYEAAVPVSGNGTYSPAGFAPGTGLYRWTVEYAGDANNEAAALGCGAANQGSTVNEATPTLSGTATSATKPGLSITDSVTLVDGFSPTGEVTFSVFGPADTNCSTPLKTAAVPLQGGHATSADFLAQQAGEFRWTVEYAGDANNEAAALGCGAANQGSTVGKTIPTLSGTAASAPKVGLSITDSVALAEGFAAGGQLVFHAYGPGDQSCASAAAYEAAVPVSGNDTYSPAGFAPGAGLYRWTVEYEGDTNNEAVALGCGAADQASAVGAVNVTVAVGATGGTVGDPVNATATIQEGAIPTGQITFKAFSPGDANCSGAAAFSSTASVSGNGQYRSSAFAPTRVGAFRWTVGYSGDVNHVPATTDCGKATSSVTQAGPSITGAVKQRVTVGTSFQDTATLQGGYSPDGTITFRIYGPVASGCAKPAFVDTVAAAGNGTFNSDPFVAKRPGRYSFVASYSGDSANRGATEPCDSAGQVVAVQKRTLKVKPRALLKEGRRISIRAHLSGGASPSGTITFRLYGPGDKRCSRKPAFSGGITVKSNGNFSLAQYIAPKSGIYRLSVGYSGDQRNRRYKGSCGGAQAIRVG